MSKKELQKLKTRILDDGFNVPLFVWDDAGEYRILDGHQRLRALLSLREEGYDIPMLPVAIIDASDEADARRKLLAISSQYGEFDTAELTEWLAEVDRKFAESLRLVDGELGLKPIETFDFSDLEEELQDLAGSEDVTIAIVVPKMHEDEIKKFLCQGNSCTGPGMGKGVMKLCGLL